MSDIKIKVTVKEVYKGTNVTYDKLSIDVTYPEVLYKEVESMVQNILQAAKGVLHES